MTLDGISDFGYTKRQFMDFGTVLGWIIIMPLIGAAIGQTRKSAGMGAVLGLLFGPLGWILVLVAVDGRPKCPDCKGRLPDNARKCMHCGTTLQQWRLFKCPACGEAGKVSEPYDGAELECPACKRGFRLPR
jgi:hypothetical protein